MQKIFFDASDIGRAIAFLHCHSSSHKSVKKSEQNGKTRVKFTPRHKIKLINFSSSSLQEQLQGDEI